MKIVYGVTISGKENTKIFDLNKKILLKSKHEIITILNSKFDKKADINIDCVSDMKGSRESLMKEASKINADMYMIFDSDILFPNNDIDKYIDDILEYKKYDFISLYYIGDPPIPAFYTLSSSLTDFYYNKLSKVKNVASVHFDDSDYNNPTYFIPKEINETQKLTKILSGKSYARKIYPFTDHVDEFDNTTGGATIYFNKKGLLEVFDWHNSEEGKSLTWYDSYRTFRMNKKYGGKYTFAKVPIFIEHCRDSENISLNWISVINYIEGYNYYMKDLCNEESEKMIIHSVQLLMYIKGIIKKILLIENKLTNEEKFTIKKIKEFINNSDYFENYYKEIKWK